MKIELGYCSFCGQRRDVVVLGEVACGMENVQISICTDCTVECARVWELGRKVTDAL